MHESTAMLLGQPGEKVYNPNATIGKNEDRADDGSAQVAVTDPLAGASSEGSGK